MIRVNDWPTKEKDMEVAVRIIKGYGWDEELALCEIIIQQNKEAGNLQIAEWVLAINDYFKEKYGKKQGEIIAKRVVTECMTNGNTVH